MKDAKREHFLQIDSNALERVQAALEFLWADKTRSIHDKIAGDFDYEELIAALLAAEVALKGYEARDRDNEE